MVILSSTVQGWAMGKNLGLKIQVVQEISNTNRLELLITLRGMYWPAQVLGPVLVIRLRAGRAGRGCEG